MDGIIKLINEAQVTKAFTNCLSCGLPSTVCICDWIKEAKQYDLGFHMHIIMHEKEIRRSTNTGRLVGFIFENNSTYYIWKRKEPSPSFLNAIEDKNNLFVLLYPTESLEDIITPTEVKEIVKSSEKRLEKKLHIVVIDSTWQESVKIVNRSPYLKEMKRLKINNNTKSKFYLRRNQSEGNLCTSEAVSVAMKELGYEEPADILNSLTSLFLKNYEKGRSGHRL